MLGHCHPKVVAAVHEQIERGTHFGASHETEIAWAEWIIRLVPSAERVRFTSSGTEATLMALRLARAFTGKPKIIRFRHHFHGWHDHMTSGFANHFDGSPTTGVLPGIAVNVLLADQNDTAGLARLFDQHDDIAAAILEPTGAHGARLPIDPAFLHDARAGPAAARTLTSTRSLGFASLALAQAEYGVTPDRRSPRSLSRPGLPGGAAAGRKDFRDLVDFQVTMAADRDKINQPGHLQRQPSPARPRPGWRH